MYEKRVLKSIGFIWLMCMLMNFSVLGQQIRLDNLKEQFSKDNLFKINGGMSANSVFYTGSNATRQPLTWMLSGNVNMSIYGQINIPLSYSINNLGDSYNYPTLPNRFSIHPTYKWITAHLGDVFMSLSPYTLSGHQFTGAGVELSPEWIPFKLQLMYGRLQRKAEYDVINMSSTVAYERMGYGLKLNYEQDRYLLGMTIFHAHDDHNSLLWEPDSLKIYPQSNLAISGEATLKLIDNLTLNIECGLSSLTRDLRIPSDKVDMGTWLLTRNTSTVQYNAIKSSVNYQLKKNAIGFGYERVDPDYQTLGGYYFTNDLQNFTFNYARPFWKEKISFSTNVGMQHDNLAKTKTEQTNRWVIAANLNFIPFKSLNFNASYSSFQSYTNIKSQFDYINSTDKYENNDTLDFTQLSQNINFNASYNWVQAEQCNHSVNVSLSFQTAADKRGDIIHPGGVSEFYNMACFYALLFVPSSIQVTTSGNLTYNTVGESKMMTLGPNVSVSSKFFDKKVSSGISLSYNVSTDNGVRVGSIFSTRGNMTWRFFKSHSTNFSAVYQARDNPLKGTTSDFTMTINYAYSF